jgi:hypothetical protein
MENEKRALYLAECCHKELADMLCQARESFEVWKSFSGVTIDDEWHKLSYYCPFVSATVTAHYLTMIINLFIIGDEDRKVHGICYLRRKLKCLSILTKAHDIEWEKHLNKAMPIQKKIKLVRNKYFAHRDKDYSWEKAMRESGLTYTALDFLISLYYRIAEASAPVLNPMFIDERMVKDQISKSIGNTKKALLLHQPVVKAKDDEEIMKLDSFNAV